MDHTYKDSLLAGALLDLVGFLNSPQRDDVLLREAGVSLDRALFPLLVRLGAQGDLAVTELADQVGRDHSTVSRQIAKLETLGLVARHGRSEDQRVRAAKITDNGEAVVLALAEARQRLFDRLFAGWSDEEREAVGRLNRRLVDAMMDAAPAKLRPAPLRLTPNSSS